MYTKTGINTAKTKTLFKTSSKPVTIDVAIVPLKHLILTRVILILSFLLEKT